MTLPLPLPLPSRRSVGAAVLGMLATGVMSGCSPSPMTNPPGKPGDTRELDSSDVGGASFTVAMPDGTYTVTQLAVHDAVGPDARRLVAPEGAVVISLNPGSSVREGVDPLVRTRTTFQVAAGGETFAFESISNSGEGIVVPGDGTDAVIEAVHEGRIARFAVTDGARLDTGTLYATSDTVFLDEHVPENEDGGVAYMNSISPTISAALVHKTFSPLGGWAPEGSTWLEAWGIGFSGSGIVALGTGEVDAVATVTSVQLLVDGSAVDADSEQTPEGILVLWVQVPPETVRAALAVTYDVAIDGEAAHTGLTHTTSEVELAGLDV